MNHLLSIILFTPLAGALILLLVNKQNENAIRWIANLVALAGFAISVPLWFWYQPSGADFQFVERAPWIPSVGAEYFLVVDRDHRAREGVLHLPARAADRHAGRVHVARLPAVLPVLGSDARADVFPDRHLGQREPPLLGDQVLPVHAR